METGTEMGAKLEPWIEPLKFIQQEGEEDHFEFFKSVFLGKHPVFADVPDVWGLPPDDPRYPSQPLPVNPSAYVGHENQIEDPVSLNLAWLGNLHYWAILLLLDLGYRTQARECIALSRAHMMGPFWSIMRHLPTLGTGMPFDLLSMGYAPASTSRQPAVSSGGCWRRRRSLSAGSPTPCRPTSRLAPAPPRCRCWTRWQPAIRAEEPKRPRPVDPSDEFAAARAGGRPD